MKNKNIKILITGESGLLGSALKLELSKLYNIVPFKYNITNFNKNEFNNYIDKIDYILHTAAITNVKSCEDDHKLCNAVNVRGTKNITNLAKYLNSKLIYISTASVFLGKKGNYKETSTPNPKSYYDISKYKGEQIVRKYKKGMVIRLNLIGIHPKGSRGLNLFEWLYNSIKNNKNMTLYNDVIVNPLSNWTIANITKKIIQKNIQFKILHIGSRDSLSKAEIGKRLINKIGGYKGITEIASIDKNSTVFRPKEMWLNVKKAENKLNIKMPKLKSEIDKILKVNKENEQHKNK